MLSLGVMKDGVMLPSEEDRKRIITQMKVRTTLRGDKSWIQQKTDSEEEQNRNSLHSPQKSRSAGGRSPTSPRTLSPHRRLPFSEASSPPESLPPPAKSPSKKSSGVTSPTGYLIRGVFTKTIDKSAPSNSASNGSPKSAKSASLPRFSPGYKMTTEDYKKIAPYNVKQVSADPEDVEPPVSPDEQRKRTEAASSVLRRTASRERSYVLSAAKKSNGSPVQDAPPFVAKRVEVEDDTGPRSRSQTVPASAWFHSRGKSSTAGERKNTSGSGWNEPTSACAASASIVDTSSRSPDHKSCAETSSTFNHFVYQEGSNKPVQEKRELSSWEDSVPKSPASPSKRSENNERKFQSTSGAEMEGAVLSQYRSSSHYRTTDADTTAEGYHRPKTVTEHLSDKDADSIRNRTDALPERRYNVSTHLSNEEDFDPKRSFSGSEKKTVQEVAYKSPSNTEYKKVETHLEKSGSLSSESNFSTGGPQSEPLRPETGGKQGLNTARSNFFSTESGVAPPESPPGEYGSSSNTTREVTFGMSDVSHRMPTYMDSPVYNSRVLESDHRASLNLDRQANNRFGTEASHGMPSYLSNQPYKDNMTEINHRMTSYRNDQAFNSGRSYSPSRDSPTNTSSGSHRMPFYKDTCDTRRNLADSDKRAEFTSSTAAASTQLKTPSASGYDSDPTASSKGLLFVKESTNSTELSSSPRYNSRSLVDLSELERSSYNSSRYLHGTPPKRPSDAICTYCGRAIRNCAKITIENLNICCHDYCFRCGICHKPMGDLLEKIFIHRDIVHCDKCYEKLF